jgi:AcrR family transcriptional regulator
MPPIPKITKDMIMDSSLEIIKKEGIENLNVRNIATKLNCSTQPIMYHYKNMDILKDELYKKVDEYHSKYLMKNSNDDPLLSIGLQYIKFAKEEKNLFKFLFQSDKFSNFNLEDLINNNENGLQDIFDIIKKETNLNIEEIKEMFTILFITAHGIASLLANNSIAYDENHFKKILETSFNKVNK